MLPERDKGALKVFLEGCRDSARKKEHYQIASISLAVKHIAPLAVLESIYEPSELHFYVEQTSKESALAGAEAVVEGVFHGEDRFAKAKAFASEVMENTIAVGDLSAAFTGPHFFAAFTFDNKVEAEGAFAPATIFLPRWQVSRFGGEYGAVANIKIDPDADLDELVERVWSAYLKFGAFQYGNHESDKEKVDQHSTIIEREELAPGVYREAVTNALKEIDSGAYEKIVLARGLRLKANKTWQPLKALNRLRERFNGCFTFSFGGGGGRSFIGATPERILRIREGELLTEAIAGSAPRGKTAGEDAKLGRNLLESQKDLWEHACVRESILRRLKKVGVEAVADAAPRLLQLANVQHLKTVIRAEVGNEVHLLDILAEMHPTPAIGGTPREEAVSRIKDLEGIDRGLYAGVVGWFNHLNECEMIVGIRSALISGSEARLYAGAGIVKGSDPDKENRETDIKLRALLDVLES